MAERAKHKRLTATNNNWQPECRSHRDTRRQGKPRRLGCSTIGSAILLVAATLGLAPSAALAANTSDFEPGAKDWTATGFQHGIEASISDSGALTWSVTDETVSMQHEPVYRGFAYTGSDAVSAISFDYEIKGTPSGNVRLELWDGVAEDRPWNKKIDAKGSATVSLESTSLTNGLEFRLTPVKQALEPGMTVVISNITFNTHSGSNRQEAVAKERSELVDRFVNHDKVSLPHQNFPHFALPDADLAVNSDGQTDTASRQCLSGFGSLQAGDCVRFEGAGYVRVQWQGDDSNSSVRARPPMVKGAIVPLGEGGAFNKTHGPPVGLKNNYYYINGEASITVPSQDAPYQLKLKEMSYPDVRDSIERVF